MAVVLTILVVAGAAFQVAPLVYAGIPAHDSDSLSSSRSSTCSSRQSFGCWMN